MIITYHGRQHIKLVYGDTTISVNPVSKSGKGRITKYGADIVMMQRYTPDYNGIDEVTRAGQVPFSIEGPGEYEVNGIFIKGIETTATIKGVPHINTIYTFTFDGIKLCFLGYLTSKFTADVREQIDEVDIVFTPAGGAQDVLLPFESFNLAASLEPKVIIPYEYDEKTLPVFLKEAGAESKFAVDKLTVKKKDLEGKNAEVVVLEEI